MIKVLTFSRCCGFLAILLFAAGCREETPEQKALRIHEEILTLDSHIDTPTHLDWPDVDMTLDNDPFVSNVDLPKMRQGGLDGAFFAAYVRQGQRDSVHFEAAKDRVLYLIGQTRDMVAAHPDEFALATQAEDARRIKEQGKRAVFIGVENGYAIGRDLSLLDTFYDLGARYVTLSHTRNNDICDSANDPAEEYGGLSDFGIEVINRMNELGMMVDISHVSEKAASQAIRISKAPVLASHSNARAICDNVRNMSDSLLMLLGKNGGVVQVCILSGYVRPDVPNPALDSAYAEIRGRYAPWATLSPKEQNDLYAEMAEAARKYPSDLATVAQAVDHIDHIVRLIGIDHVGIGTDFDGGGQLADCQSAADLPKITVELMRRGYTRADLEKIWSGNLLRVMQQAQDYASQK